MTKATQSTPTEASYRVLHAIYVWEYEGHVQLPRFGEIPADWPMSGAPVSPVPDYLLAGEFFSEGLCSTQIDTQLRALRVDGLVSFAEGWVDVFGRWKLPDGHVLEVTDFDWSAADWPERTCRKQPGSGANLNVFVDGRSVHSRHVASRGVPMTRTYAVLTSKGRKAILQARQKASAATKRKRCIGQLKEPSDAQLAVYRLHKMGQSYRTIEKALVKLKMKPVSRTTIGRWIKQIGEYEAQPRARSVAAKPIGNGEPTKRSPRHSAQIASMRKASDRDFE